MSSTWTFLLLTLALPAAPSAGQVATAPRRAPVPLTAPLQDKNFYLLSLIERSSEAAKAMEADETLRTIAGGKRGAPAKAAQPCVPDPACFTEPFRFTEEEITGSASALRRLYRTSEPIRRMTDGPLRESGMYVRYHRNTGADLLAAAWLDAARGVNNIIDVYASGKAPRYPQIDSPAFDITTRSYRALVQTAAGVLDERRESLRLFFQPSLKFALYLLSINKRDEAGRHEPLETKDNQAALARLKGIAWERFPYTVIVVLGEGPDRTGWSLSSGTELRLELAARRFEQRKAPLLLVSGGYVHPSQTPYAEALEMKKALIARYGIPAEAILVDPHARHTTTNLRNAARLMFRYAIPFDRKALVTTDGFHSSYIDSAEFVKRCQTELGYQPHKIAGRTSAFDLEFFPLIDSLQIDPLDPLDP